MELLQRIEKALESVRPYLNKDGGDVEIVEITDEGVLKVKMVGACGSCSISPITLKTGIEQAVLESVPEIKSVEAINLMSGLPS